MRWIACLLAISLLAACGGDDPRSEPTATPTPEAVEVSGVFVLYDNGCIRENFAGCLDGYAWLDPSPGDDCEGQGGYSDINQGTEVRLLSDGKLLDVTRLGMGTLGQKPTIGAKMACTFEFTLNVPGGHEFYTVEIGRRGSNSYRASEILAPNTLSYSLGDSRGAPQ